MPLLHFQPSRQPPALSAEKRLIWSILTVVAGWGAYGFTMGVWRGGMMGLVSALKLPSVIAITLLINALLNTVMALLLGSGLGFRQTLHYILTGFATAGLLLASLAPVILFFTASAAEASEAHDTHAGLMLFHVLGIAFAGCLALARLRAELVRTLPGPKAADATLIGWMAGNGFVGAQIAWIMRPFFGSPQLGVAWFREDALSGSFYEAIAHSTARLVPHLPMELVISACLLAMLLLVSGSLQRAGRKSPRKCFNHDN